MSEESAYHNIEQEDSRTKLIKELTEENHSKDVLITELREQLKNKFDYLKTLKR